MALTGASETDTRAALERTGIGHLFRKSVHHLSGGEMQRLLLAQSHPRQLLHQWLSLPDGDLIFDGTFEEQLKGTQDELKRLQRSQQQMTTLMAQVKDQQRRTRRLLASLLTSAQPQED